MNSRMTGKVFGLKEDTIIGGARIILLSSSRRNLEQVAHFMNDLNAKRLQQNKGEFAVYTVVRA